MDDSADSSVADMPEVVVTAHTDWFGLLFLATLTYWVFNRKG